jgi:2-polyprenyl-6-methoxyphenol hydroxylase-like FAD-dependent oxidoreductase
LAGIDVVIVERRTSQDVDGSRGGGLHSRTIEVLDQRGIAERFLSAGQMMQVQGYALIPLDISDFPTRHNYGVALSTTTPLGTGSMPTCRRRAIGIARSAVLQALSLSL